MSTSEQIALALISIVATVIVAAGTWYTARGAIGTVERAYGFLRQRWQARRLRKSEGELHERRR